MFRVQGYALDAARRYDPERHLWVAQLAGRAVRVGMDPLGAQTAGDIVAISFVAAARQLRAGDTFATIEAAKFVGPLQSPVSGTIRQFNEHALLVPGSVNADPFGVWLVELADVPAAELDRLLFGEAAVRPWFEQAVARLRREGVLAE